MNKIQRVSRIFRILFQLVFIGLIIYSVIGWIKAPEPVLMFGRSLGINFMVLPHHMPPILHTVTNQERIYGFLAYLIPLVIQLWLIKNLITLFRLYEKGKIFLLKNVRALKRIGMALLLNELIYPFYQAAVTAIFTWHNPKGHRMAVAGFDGTNMGLLLVGIMVILVSWVMAEGCKLQSENEMTI